MFSDEERQLFSDWINEFERLVRAMHEDDGVLRRCPGTHRDRYTALERAFEDHLNNGPADMTPRRIILGGGGMNGVYGPPLQAPPDELEDLDQRSDHTDHDTMYSATHDSVSAGVGQPIYIDPLAYRDWGWTKHDPRPAPKPMPIPSLGTQARRSS